MSAFVGYQEMVRDAPPTLNSLVMTVVVSRLDGASSASGQGCQLEAEVLGCDV